MKRSNLILRSLMFVPGHNEKLMVSAARSIADALIPDVEDSVPAVHKQTARDLIVEKAAAGIFGKKKIFPRINDRESGYCLKDVYQLTVKGIDGFVYPKSMKGEDIYFFDKLLETIEYEKNFPVGTFKIIPLIETTGAVLDAHNICLASERVVALAFGCEDYVADLEGVHDPQGNSIYTARNMIALAARAAGVIPVDTVHIHVHDLVDLEKNLKLARTLGFEGMLVLHPKELELAHRYFTPGEDEIADAREMLRLSQEAEKENRGVAVYNGKFVGPPMVVAAKKIIQRDLDIKRQQEENRP